MKKAHPLVSFGIGFLIALAGFYAGRWSNKNHSDCEHKFGKWHETRVTDVAGSIFQESTCEKCGLNRYTRPIQP